MSADPFAGPLWAGIRRLILFVLGVVVIIEALVNPGQNIGTLLVGTLLVGVVPMDELMGRLGRGRRGEHVRRRPPPVETD